MGDKGDKGKIKKGEIVKVTALILSVFLISCHYVKQESLLPESAIYSGDFVIFQCQNNKRESGLWEALEEKGKIKKIYLYTKFGFPIGTIEIKNQRVIFKNKEIELGSWKAIIDELPSLARKKEIKLKRENAEIIKKENTIIVLSTQGWLKVNIKNIRAAKPPFKSHEGL